uniref:Uncharacterized protein n=1 Tax=Timema monikensis TaxID=170555 RepID=A0A7R9EEZ1_9NEOP|nr:unnamed protein product [Timema monikensis]
MNVARIVMMNQETNQLEGLTPKEVSSVVACHVATWVKSLGSPSTSWGCRSSPRNQVQRSCKDHLAVRQAIRRLEDSMAEHTYMRPNDGSPSSRFNGKINGVEGKTPFLIGVAGGTASGKVGYTGYLQTPYS